MNQLLEEEAFARQEAEHAAAASKRKAEEEQAARQKAEENLVISAKILEGEASARNVSRDTKWTRKRDGESGERTARKRPRSSRADIGQSEMHTINMQPGIDCPLANDRTRAASRSSSCNRGGSACITAEE